MARNKKKVKSTKGVEKKAPPKAKKRTSKFREYTESIVIAIILALFIRTFLIQAFRIPTASMEDTLLIGDFLLVNKFIYGTKIPFTDIEVGRVRPARRGDIIVFKAPDGSKKDFIKRVVAAEGDTIEVREKILYINNEKQTEPHTKHIALGSRQPRDNYGPEVVPEGHLFMMGDNRDNSHDSRFWGFLDERRVKGLAVILYFSIGQKESFRLTNKSFTKLGKENIPPEIITQLGRLKNRQPMTKEKFLRNVEKLIGKIQLIKYKELILKHSEHDICLFNSICLPRFNRIGNVIQ